MQVLRYIHFFQTFKTQLLLHYMFLFTSLNEHIIHKLKTQTHPGTGLPAPVQQGKSKSDR